MNRYGKHFLLILIVLGMVSCAGLLGPDLKPARKLSEAGDHAGALKVYTGIIDAGKASPKVYRLAYESAFEAGRFKTAGTLYEQAINAGFDADSMRNLATQLWYTRAITVMGMDEWDAAREAADALSSLVPDSKESKICNLIIAGRKKFDRGAHKGLWDAVNNYTKASVLDPTIGLPHFLSGQARFKNNRTDYDAALEDYYLALKVEPDAVFAERAKAEIKKIEATKAKMKAFWGK